MLIITFCVNTSETSSISIDVRNTRNDAHAHATEITRSQGPSMSMVDDTTALNHFRVSMASDSEGPHYAGVSVASHYGMYFFTL